MKKILITGCAGFIGFHISKLLLEKKNIVIGIDNLNNYYSLKLKKHRLKCLLKYSNFKFNKIEINNLKSLNNVFLSQKFDVVINLAAQAGVSHSVKYPEKYFNSNIHGFFNICNLSKKYKIKKVIYASSSSVYGDSKKLPVKEFYNTNPLNYYAISKENNEKTADFFSKNSNIDFIGLRFFSIYGPYGRPDMLIYKLLNSYKNNKIFYLNNNGNHTRDFTFIDDATFIIYKLLTFKVINQHEIFNISNTRRIKLLKLINLINREGITPKIVKRGFQKGDIKNACGSNKKIKTFLKRYKFTPFEVGLKKTLIWYEKNKKIF